MRPVVALYLICSCLAAQELPEADQRYGDIRHTDSVFEMPEYSSASEWRARAAYLRRQILWTAGLVPMPDRTPLSPRVSGRFERDGYSIEKVLVETSPGFYLGGNLYRPLGPAQPRSAVLLSHGHWAYGRLENSERASPPTLAANLALQGHIVFAYDMVGHNDTLQFPHDALGAKREELWNINLLGLQLWNSIRALDFLESLAGVDASRIYAAGASGGATQALLLTAVDERVSAVALVNMISFHMQGGDVCENAPGLRIDTNNVELTVLIAPRPLFLVSATGDWTVNTLRREFPAVRSIYELLGQGDQVQAVQFDAPHNFNKASREAVYTFFARREDSFRGPVGEHSISLPQPSELLSLWNGSLPPNALQSRPAYVDQRIDTAQASLIAVRGSPSVEPSELRLASRERLQLALRVAVPSAEALHSKVVETWRNGELFAIGREGMGDRVPGVLLRPRRVRDWVKPTVIIHPEGSAWTMGSAESRDGFVSKVLSRGGSVMAVDVYQTGHARVNGDAAATASREEPFLTTFNRTDTSQRVQDILTVIAHAQQRFETEQIQLICPQSAGLWCALARAFVDAPIDMVIDWDHFDAASDAGYLEHVFVSGIRKAGGFQTAVALWSAGRTVVFNADESFSGSSDANLPGVDVRPGSFDWDGLLEWTAPRRRPR